MSKVPGFNSVDITGQNNSAINPNNLQVANDGSAIQTEQAIRDYVTDLKNGLIGENELEQNVLLSGFVGDVSQNMSSKKRKLKIRSEIDYSNNQITFECGPKPGCNYWSPQSVILMLNLAFQKSAVDDDFPTDIIPCADFFNYYFEKIEIFDTDRNNESFFTQTTNKSNIQKNRKWYSSLPIPPDDSPDVRANANLFITNKKPKYLNRRRMSNNATLAERTNDDIKERHTFFKKKFSKTKQKVNIEMKYLCEFFNIKYLENRVKVVITLQNKMEKIFDKVGQSADASALTAIVKIVSTPRMLFSSYAFNAATVQKQKNVANYTGGQFLHTYGSCHETKKELPAGISEIEVDIPLRGKKIKKIGISMSTKNSHAHSTPYDDRYVETASVDIKKIRLLGAPVPGNFLEYNLEEEEDKMSLYDDFLQHHYNTSNEDSPSSYAEFVNHYKMPSYDDYYDRTPAFQKRFGHEIILDLAATKNSFAIPDKTKTCDNMKLTLNFQQATRTESATVSGQVLLINYYFDSSIVQIYSKEKGISEMLTQKFPDQEITFKDLAMNKGKPTLSSTGVIKHLHYF